MALIRLMGPQPAFGASGPGIVAERILHPKLRIPTAIVFEAPIAPLRAADSVQPAFPNVAAPAFGIQNSEAEMLFASVATDQLGWRHERYEQIHDGVSVFSGQLIAHYDQTGRLRSVNGRYYPLTQSFNTRPSVTEDVARQAGRAALANEDAQVLGSDLVIVDPGWYGDPSVGPRLAYFLRIASEKDLHEIGLFIDAQTGATLDSWDMFCTLKQREVYSGVGQTELPGSPARFEGAPPTGISDVDAVYDYSGDTHDYFLFGFNRNGPDDAGGAVAGTAEVDDIGALGCPNAGWSFNLQLMVFCSGTASDDIVAHEWVHALTQNTANLIYQNQSGQLNESFSDVFGELVDLFNGGAAFAGTSGLTPWVTHASGSGTDDGNALRSDSCTSLAGNVRWIVGEDAFGFPQPLRDMWEPNCYMDPAAATDPLQVCALGDGGGVHSGSGIVNHAFAMLCDGKSFNGQDISAIGPIKAGAIWYRTLTAYLTVGSDYSDAYWAFIQAAQDLVGVDPQDPRTGFPSGDPITMADVQQVINALNAVELTDPDSCGATRSMLSPELPSNCSNEQIVFADDFESGVNQWSVANSAPPTPYDWVQVSNLPFDRPGTAWFIEDASVGDCNTVDESATHDLISPTFVYPTDADTLTLEFTHFAEVEPRFDGGVAELSVNGGAFAIIPSAAFRNNAYNTSLFTAAEQSNTSPLAGQIAFSGVGGDWGVTTVELAGLAAPGDSLQLRFRFSKDICFGYTGWWIDDLRVFTCGGIDCNQNGIDDEIDRIDGPADRLLMAHELNRRATANFSDDDLHPLFGTNEVAEDFQLLFPAAINRITFWGGYEDDMPVATDEFSIRIYENNNGIPGMLIHEESGPPASRIATGEIFFRNDEYLYEYTLAVPPQLSAGDYMISIANNTSGSATTWLWARAWAGDIPGTAFRVDGCPDWCRINPFNMALELYGERVGYPPGDMNRDESVNLSDIPLFVEEVLAVQDGVDDDCLADMNSDRQLNGVDVAEFSARLVP